MDRRTSLRPNRKFPSTPTIIDDLRNHTLALQSIAEAVGIGARHTANTLDSFVRIRELVDLGLIELKGDTLVTITPGEAAAGAAATDAADVAFDNTLSALVADDVQEAIDELDSLIDALTVVPRQFGAAWGSASALVAGSCRDVVFRAPTAGTITGAYVFGLGGTGSAVIDVWRDSYANFPPTVADTITASAKPTITTSNKSSDTTLTGWANTFSAGDLLVFHVDSVSTFTDLLIYLTYEPA